MEAEAQQSPQNDDDALRKRLLTRVMVAGLVIVGLLGGLVLFDDFYVRMTKSPAPVAKIETPTKPIEPAEEERPAGKVEEKPAEKAETKETATEPERTAAPIDNRGKAERPLTLPATARPAIARPGEPVAVVPKPEPAKEIARVLPSPSPAAPASRPIARAVESARQFLVQVGVFGNLANAEELRAKLELAGVPTQIEARVQVGPFATRQEAEQARDKLKELGIESGLIVAARK